MDAAHVFSVFSARRSRGLAGLALCCAVLVGCDLGLEESSNRYQQLNDETKLLVDQLRQVTDTASAQQRLPEIQALGAKIRQIQEGVFQAEKDNQMGVAKATNVRQMQLFFQVSAGVVRHLDRINKVDPKVAEPINKALEGITWQ
jgi:hypothetical protein